MGQKKHSRKNPRFNDDSVKFTHKGLPKKKIYIIKKKEDMEEIKKHLERER